MHTVVTVRLVERVVHTVGNGTAALVPEARRRQSDQCQTMNKEDEGEQTNRHNSRHSFWQCPGQQCQLVAPPF